MTSTDAEFEVFCPGVLEVLSIGRGDLKLSVGDSEKDRDEARALIEEMLRTQSGQRFAAKIDVDPDSGCWLWTASLRPNGYAQFNAGDHRIVRAHRWSYEQCRGPVPAGLDLDHLCHNLDLSCPGGPTCRHRRCVNPWHVEPSTRAANLAAGRGAETNRRRASRQTRCKRGHPLSGPNLRVRATGARQYVACGLERTREWRARRKVG